MRRALTIGLFSLGLWLLPASGAAAVGGPVPPVQGGAGATAPGSDAGFVALKAGKDSTTVQRQIRGRGVDGSVTIEGNFGVPGAGFDGSTTGLSADGRTLVLAGITREYPAATTELAVLDAVRLRERARVSLPGTYVVDAISPDGRWLYFTHYKSRSGVDYEVLAYDLQQRHLIAKPIVDRREPDEKMQGNAVTRLMSPDGRWAYTLYARPDEKPFIHALDTVNRAAACIDLPLNTPPDQVYDMRLRFGPGGMLNVMSHEQSVLAVNTRTFAVSNSATAGAAPKPAPNDSGGGSDFPWALMIIPAAAALAGLGVLARRRRRLRSAPA